MTISSKALFRDGKIPDKYTGLGKNVNPPLEFDDLPEGAKGLVVIMEDMDSSDLWTHWLLFNIPAQVDKIDENSSQAKKWEGLANGGTFGYEGPNQRFFYGTHRYRFSLFALDTILAIPQKSDKQKVHKKMQDHILAQAQLITNCTSPFEKDQVQKNLTMD